MKLVAIFIKNHATVYGGVQPLRQSVLFVFVPFDKNTLGDIIAIRDEDGNVVAKYIYDAWGNILHEEGGMASVNPFRYRGYYYDTETGFYYLQTRYYDPTICRFINADNYELIAELSSVAGQLNLYAYANNNPIMYTDETGCMANWLKWVIGGVAFAGAIALTVATGGALGPVIFGMASSILLGGALSGIGSYANGGDFWEGFANGAADGAMWGGIFALSSATISAVNYFVNAKGAVAGTKHLTTIRKGQQFYRYGSLKGKYITDIGTPASALALPSTNSGVRITLQTTKNFRAYTGIVAPAFGGTGGGVQYVMRYSIEKMIQMGWLIIV